jgi:DNA excision repair protein ERCC-2
MPTGTGKTISVLSLVTSYQLAHPECGKLVYCTRTVPEMEKARPASGVGPAAQHSSHPCGPLAQVLAELRNLQAYREPLVGKAAQILAIGLSSRKNMCIHPKASALQRRRRARRAWLTHPPLPRCRRRAVARAWTPAVAG